MGLNSRRPGYAGQMTELTLDSLRTAFHLPREAAAEALGVTVNELKKALKLLKIERWPFRKLSSLQALQADLEEQLNELESSDDNRNQALELREMHARIGEDMAKIRLDPNHPLDEALHKLRLQNYKARFIKQHGGGPAGKGRRSSASTARPSPGAAVNPLLPKSGAQGILAGPGAAGPNFGAEPTQSTGSASSGARRAASSAQLKRSADMASMGLWGPSGSSASGLHSLSRSRRALGQPLQPPLPRSVAPPVVNLPDGRAPGLHWGRPHGYNGQPGGQGHMHGGAGAVTLAALPGLPEDDVLDGLGTGYRSAYSAPLYDETTASHLYGHTARGPVGHSSEAQLNRQYSGVSGLKDGVAAIKLEQYDGQYSGASGAGGAGSTHGRPSLDQVAAGGTPPWMVPLGVPNWQPQTSQASRYTSCPADWGQQQQGGLPPAQQQQQQQQTYQQTRFGQAGTSQPLPGPGGQQQQQPQQQPWDMAPRRMRTVTPKATPLEEMLAELAQSNPVNPDGGAMSMPFGAPMHSMQQQQRQQYMQGGMSMPVMGHAMFDGVEGGVIQGNPGAWPVSNSGLEQHAMAQQSGQIGGQAGATAGASGVTYQQPPRSTVLGHEPPLPSSYFLLNSDDEDDDEISRLLSGAPSQPLAGGLARAPRSMNVMQQAAPEYAYRAPNTAPMPAYNSDVVFGAGGRYGHASQAQAQGLGQGVSGQPGAPMRIANEVVHQHGEPQVQPVPATVVTTGHNVQPAPASTQQWGAEAHGFQTQQQQQLQHHHSGALPQLQNHHQLLQQHHSAGSKPPGLTRHSMPARAPAFVTLQHGTDGASAYGSLQALSMPPAGESMRFGVVQQQLQQQPEVQVNPKGEGHQPQVAAWLAQQQQMAGHVYQQQPPQQLQQAAPTQQQQQQQQALGDRAWPPSSGTVSVGALLEGLPDQGPGSVNGTTAAGYGNQMDTNMDPGTGPTMAELQQLLDDEMGL